MNSFSFNKEIPVEALVVLDTSKDLDMCYEIVTGGINPRSKIEYSDFNQMGYTTNAKKYAIYKQDKDASKLVHLVDEDFVEHDNKNTRGGMSLNSIPALDEGYAYIEDSDELKYAISQLESLRKGILVETGTDIIVLIKRALEGTPKAVDKLKDLCVLYSEVSECVKSLLSGTVGVRGALSLT